MRPNVFLVQTIPRTYIVCPRDKGCPLILDFGILIIDVIYESTASEYAVFGNDISIILDGDSHISPLYIFHSTLLIRSIGNRFTHFYLYDIFFMR